jgi:hypothetical protein
MNGHGLGIWSLVLGLTLLAPAQARAHCDSLDGPVVKAAQKALETRNLDYVLIWIQEKDEQEIRGAFEQALNVRALSAKAKDLADRFFFETVVRIHRVGEGASYTGLKPAGRDLGPAIPMADKALDEGSIAPVVSLLTRAMETRLRTHFDETVAHRMFKPSDVAAGREYVRAYVEFIHYVERLYAAITASAHGHFAEEETAGHARSTSGIPRR